MSEETTQNFPGDDLRGIHARFDSIDGRLTSLEDKVDRRLQDTRPIWELVLTRLDAIEGKMGGLEGKMVNLEGKMGGLEGKVGSIEGKVGGIEGKVDSIEGKVDSIEIEMRRGFRRLERMVGQLSKDVIEVRAAQSDLDSRMDKLEDERAQR